MGDLIVKVEELEGVANFVRLFVSKLIHIIFTLLQLLLFLIAKFYLDSFQLELSPDAR